MKKVILISCVILCAFSGIAQQQKASKYAVKSGHAEYKLTGNTTGTKSVWWDDYGNISYTEEKSKNVTKILGMKNETETHNIHVVNGDQFWSANMLDKTGQKGTNPYHQPITDYANSLTDAEIKKLEQDILNAYNGKRLAPEMMNGYMCEVIEMMGVKVWVHKGVLIKSVAKMLGMELFEEASLVQLNISVPKSKFEPVPGIKYEDISKYLEDFDLGFDEDDEDDD